MRRQNQRRAAGGKNFRVLFADRQRVGVQDQRAFRLPGDFRNDGCRIVIDAESWPDGADTGLFQGGQDDIQAGFRYSRADRMTYRPASAMLPFWLEGSSVTTAPSHREAAML